MKSPNNCIPSLSVMIGAVIQLVCQFYPTNLDLWTRSLEKVSGKAKRGINGGPRVKYAMYVSGYRVRCLNDMGEGSS